MTAFYLKIISFCIKPRFQTPYPFFERNIRIILIYSLNIKIFKISTIINHQQKQNMHQLGLWLIFILIAFPRLLHAQPYYFKHYQINDGLSNNTVICSMQDSYGFLWFGTKDGLDRFDGNEFKHFDLRNPVRNTIANNIISLIEDD